MLPELGQDLRPLRAAEAADVRAGTMSRDSNELDHLVVVVHACRRATCPCFAIGSATSRMRSNDPSRRCRGSPSALIVDLVLAKHHGDRPEQRQADWSGPTTRTRSFAANSCSSGSASNAAVIAASLGTKQTVNSGAGVMTSQYDFSFSVFTCPRRSARAPRRGADAARRPRSRAPPRRRRRGTSRRWRCSRRWASSRCSRVEGTGPTSFDAGHLQVVVDVLAKPRRLHHVGELDLAPVTALVAAPQQLVQPAGLVLGPSAAPRAARWPCSSRPTSAPACSLLKSARFLLYSSSRSSRGFSVWVNFESRSLQHLLLGEVELLDRLAENAVRHVLEGDLHVRRARASCSARSRSSISLAAVSCESRTARSWRRARRARHAADCARLGESAHGDHRPDARARDPAENSHH